VAALTDADFQRRLAGATAAVVDPRRGEVDRNVRFVLRALGVNAPRVDLMPDVAHAAS
jgi:hypothetical protein